MKKSQETGPLNKMWTIICLGRAVFYRQAYIQLFFRLVVTQRQKGKVDKNFKIFRNNGPFITLGEIVTAKFDKSNVDKT
jgi:hypothetical protein